MEWQLIDEAAKRSEGRCSSLACASQRAEISEIRRLEEKERALALVAFFR